MILAGSQSSFSRTLYLFDAFGSMSGLKVNYDKTEYLWIGSFKNSNSILFSNKQITWAKGKVYALGVWFSTLEENGFYINFSEKIERIKNILNSWSARRSNLVGKITIINLYQYLILYMFYPLSQLIRVQLKKSIPCCMITSGIVKGTKSKGQK